MATNKSRVSLDTELHMDKKILKRAIFHVVMMWGDSHYERFLRRKKPGWLDEDLEMFDWFDWFLGGWGVGRTINKRKREYVRRYLDEDFRKRLACGDKGIAVDDAAKHLKNEGCGASQSSGGNGPLSLVSKIGFFLKPNTFAPWDKYARRGLKRLLREHGVSRSKIKSYSDYLNAWEAIFKPAEKRIRKALSERWVTKLAKRLGCPVAALELRPFRRKVFDNYLMDFGGRNGNNA